jgi:ribonuclease P/MRP protein subunit RPP1
MTKFIDLHLCVPFEDVEQQRKLIFKTSKLGYSLVGIPLPPNVSSDVVKNLHKLCNEAGLNFVTRIDLAPRTPRELLEDLRRRRRKFEIVSVLCSSKPVARQAAKDRRVDLLSFSATNPRYRFFDRAEAQLASASLASLEIDLAPFLLLEGFLRTRLIKGLRKELSIAKRFRVPVVISSGASNEFMLRKPHDSAALTFLFDLDFSLAVKALSTSSLDIVERNRQKLSSGFITPGLRVVRKGKDNP